MTVCACVCACEAMILVSALVGIDFGIKRIALQEKKIKMQIW